MKFIKSMYAIIISSAILPLTALAQFGYPVGGIGINPITTGGFGSGVGGGYTGSGYLQTRAYRFTNFDSLLGLAHTLLGYFQLIIFLLAIAMALVGAWKIIVGGNFEAGRPNLLWAFLGVVIAMLSFAIIPFACWITQASGPACVVGSII